MFEFLRAVNPQDAGAQNHLTHDRMLQAAEELGRLAVGFVPREFTKSRAKEVLRTIGLFRDSQADPIQRLIQNGVLQEVQFGSDNLLRFSLDTVAEVLAAMALAKECGSAPEQWRELESQIHASGQTADKFAQILRLTRRTYSSRYNWWDGS